MFEKQSLDALAREKKIEELEKRCELLENSLSSINSYLEELKIKEWFAQFTYDKKISKIEMDNMESYKPGNRQKLLDLKNICNGKRCFIIGNGPSLRAEDLTKIKGEISFAVNSITKIFSSTEWRPTYYFCADVGYGEAIDENLDIIPMETKILMSTDMYSEKRSREVMYYMNIGRYSIIPEFNTSPFEFVYEGGTIIYHILQFAVYMGFKEIYLMGIDNDFPKKKLEDGRVVPDYFGKESIHFYEDGKEEKAMQELLEPWIDYGNLRSSGTYDTNDSFNAVKYHCDLRNIKVCNVTRGGKLETFPRQNLEDIICKVE